MYVKMSANIDNELLQKIAEAKDLLDKLNKCVTDIRFKGIELSMEPIDESGNEKKE